MELNSFVVTIREFLTFEKERSRGNKKELLFFDEISQYSIPLYQREYKWKKVRVSELIYDIKDHNKFLGIIILNRRKDSYDIIDGQQRVTTMLLLLAALFNRMGKEDSAINLEQQYIMKFIAKNNIWVLKNESIGEWLHLENNRIVLKIDKEQDVYCQQDIFNEHWDDIKKWLEEINADKVFTEHLLESKVLVLICDNLERTYSSEQIFLDMNDKVDALDAEDIFKSYCFSIVYSEHHDILKTKWIQLKSNYFKLKELGWNDFSTFLYHYILCLDGCENIQSNLKIKGIHFLENKKADDIIHLLEEMNGYTENLCKFKKNLHDETYRFHDICPNIMAYNNVDITALKDMCKYILYQKDQYYKFPFLMLVNYLYKDSELKETLKYMAFRRIISNYYIYTFAFVNRKGGKDKSQINRTIFRALKNSERTLEYIIGEIKQLRKESVNLYTLPDKFNNENEQIYALYTIMDCFDLQENNIPIVYNLKNKYNDEHFLIHDNKTYNIDWVIEADEKFKISIHLSDYYDKNILKKWRDSFANHLIILGDLNEELKSFDIVTKINGLEKYYKLKCNGCIPKHVLFYIRHIKEMDTYRTLETLKDLDVADRKNKPIIVEGYKKFLDAYFNDTFTENLKSQLQEEFQNIFISAS